MAVQTRVKVARMESTKNHGLDRDTLVRIYRNMFLSRRLDDREIQLKPSRPPRPCSYVRG